MNQQSDTPPTKTTSEEDELRSILRERAENFRQCYASDPAAISDDDIDWIVLTFRDALESFATRRSREAYERCAEIAEQEWKRLLDGNKQAVFVWRRCAVRIAAAIRSQAPHEKESEGK